MFKILDKIIGEVIKWIIEGVKKWWQRRRSRKRAEAEQSGYNVQNDIVITDTLQTILREVKADRGYIIQKHNGGKFWSGSSMRKVSMTHEVLRDPLTDSPKTSISQNLLISTIFKWYSMVCNHKFVFKDVRDLLHVDVTIYGYMERFNVKSVVNAPIYDPLFNQGKEPVAFIGVEWTSSPAPDFCEIYGTEEKAYSELMSYGKSLIPFLRQ